MHSCWTCLSMTQSETWTAQQENMALALGFHRLRSQLIIIHIWLQGEAEAMTNTQVTLAQPKRTQTGIRNSAGCWTLDNLVHSLQFKSLQIGIICKVQHFFSKVRRQARPPQTSPRFSSEKREGIVSLADSSLPVFLVFLSEADSHFVNC